MRDENLNEFDEASNNNDDVSLPDTDIVGILLGHPKVQTLMTTHGRVARSDMKTNLVATINGIIEGCNLLAAAARRDVASDTRLYQEAEVAGRRKRDAEIRDLSETYGEEVQKAFDELYESSIGLIREELQLKHDEPCINGFDGELALITAHRDALNDELAERGLTVEKLAKNAKDFAVAPSQKKPANVEDGHSSTELLKGANELLDKAWNRHRDAEQALTVLYALTAQEPQSTEQVLAEHRARMNGETQTDARFEERVKKAVELRAGTEFALRDANDTFENGKAEAQKQYEGDLEPFRNNYLNAVEEKEKAEANAILWRGIRSRVGKVAENVVNLIEVRKNRQSGAKVLKL